MEKFEQPKLGPEFSKAEKQRLEFLRRLVEMERIGGPQDEPTEREWALSSKRELAEWERIDPAWKSISPEKREELRRLLKEVAQKTISPPSEPRRSKETEGLFSEKEREPLSIVHEGSPADILFYSISEKYPEWDITIEKNEGPLKNKTVI